MMSKWSAKPADHKATRLRNNQRRHRKRVKDQIVELETRLADTQTQLNCALTRIDELSRELDQSKMHNKSMSLRSLGESKDHSTAVDAAAEPLEFSHGCLSVPVGESAMILGDDHCPLAQRGNDEPIQQPSLLQSETIPIVDPSCTHPPQLLAPSGNDIMLQGHLPDYEAFAGSADSNCCHLPPPEPGKSTTRCRDAYLIIAQQNYKGLDSTALRSWLEPGFRGAIREGDGCRVETDLLFALLDLISSSH
ncbi:hypothetical protein BGZ61DRAFT_458383 [Ilyonectria robusta]|uniref:uncharacterized protein n=1 Tax=Ilyonectria robusta TaxID=1079257 RepID=UPI001E8ECE60|nr:uncharacterized protein BGZ61DRAFT_458383 [Ilyonectria robusta]KAH8675132.1 hypothetical protein BGZ61DRAFT_458383 [Ilyonectria robusta]